MSVRRLMAVLLAAVLAVALTACGEAADFAAGTPLTSSEAADLQAQLQQEAAESGAGATDTGGSAAQTPAESSPVDSNIPPNGIVFWVDGGQVYHLSETCYHIAQKTAVRAGTAAEALAASKARACTDCSAD